jgi:hypothetical protein
LKSVHRAKFIEGAKRRLASGQLAPGKPAAMDWTDSVYAPYLTDLFYALGGFTTHSHVSVSVAACGQGKCIFTFDSWDLNVSDRYNWDPGKATLIPGVGSVTDDEMLALEQAGYGKPFDVVSEVVRITDREVTASTSIP